tara:strand:- start:345 stop:938 length:594 start_codon:yes stop_codon:yes gene_type:complete
MDSSLNLYVSSNGVDHGPLSLEEAIQKVGSGQFQPDDLSWHQGVSGWIKLKELPEWPQINKPPLPSLTPEKTPPVEEQKQTNSSIKSTPQAKGKIKRKITTRRAVDSTAAFEQSSAPVPKTGMGALGKLMVAMAILVFLCTFAVVGFLVYKNLDRFIPSEVETPPIPSEVEAPPPVTEPVTEEPTESDEPDPFAPPQ